MVAAAHGFGGVELKTSVSVILLLVVAVAAPHLHAATAGGASYYPKGCLSDTLPSPVDAVVAEGFIRNEDYGYYPHLSDDGSEIRSQDDHVRVSVWRHACRPELGPPTPDTPAALLVRIDSLAGKTHVWMPNIHIHHHSDSFYVKPRVAAQPYTHYSDLVDRKVPAGRSYVLEPSDEVGGYNDALRVDVDYGAISVELNAFAPEPKHYPQQFGAVPLSGGVNGIYMDPHRSGEGMNLQVLNVGDTQLLDVAWFTYRQDGTPLWLGGSAKLQAGDKEATINLFSANGGGFAGDFGADVDRVPWGAMTIIFPGCNEARISYASDHRDSALPSGSGLREWVRLSKVDGLDCG